MTTGHTPLATTTRYLRFPLAEHHRVPLQDGSACPHCAGKHVQKWGRFSGRQRYRCRTCGRTFSTFTATALHHLKRPDHWRRFLWCHDGRLTVRSSAAVLGVHKDTALRWRHRLLDHWRTQPRPRLRGRIVVGDFCVPRSQPGSRSLSRPPRHHGEGWTFHSLQTDPVTVVVAWERRDTFFISTVGGHRIRSADYDARIAPRLRDVTGIIGQRGPLCPLATFSYRLGVPYHQGQSSFWEPMLRVRRELRAWLRPFRGVATRRLDNYFEWFRRRGDMEPRIRAGPTVPADRARWRLPGG